MGIWGKFRRGIFVLCTLLGASPAFAAETVTYIYDEHGRSVMLVTSGTVNNGETVTVAIDTAGNRITYTVTGA